MGKGSNRDWGYASYTDDGRLIYTSYEKSGSVNRYEELDGGGHTHEHWKDKDDYNAGKEPDQARYESNSKDNPSTGEVQSNGGCYLTSACMEHFKSAFDDNCYELTVLRWFRDNFVSKNDIEHYYNVAPIIVAKINSEEKSNDIYNYIYDSIIDYCVTEIENGHYEEAYKRYKESILALEKHYIEHLKKQTTDNKVRKLINLH